MSKHSSKIYIKKKRKKQTKNKKKNMRKSYRNHKSNKKTHKTYKLKGGGAGGYTFTPSPIMNTWYNIMSYPQYLSNIFNGSNNPSYLNSDPTTGHLL
tara:strand:+ start:643 stop:933 length:291 start_codon:yes stop_codon:yes gene_type:complete